MPSVSIAQRKAMGMAYAAKKGKLPVTSLNGASLRMYNYMTEDQLRDFAKTKHTGLPNKVAMKCPSIVKVAMSDKAKKNWLRVGKATFGVGLAGGLIYRNKHKAAIKAVGKVMDLKKSGKILGLHGRITHKSQVLKAFRESMMMHHANDWTPDKINAALKSVRRTGWFSKLAMYRGKI